VQNFLWYTKAPNFSFWLVSQQIVAIEKKVSNKKMPSIPIYDLHTMPMQPADVRNATSEASGVLGHM
jgi:hypothetical protein